MFKDNILNKVIILKKHITLGYLDLQPNLASNKKLRLEKYLQKLWDIKVINLESTDEILEEDISALLITDWNIPDDNFVQWLNTFEKKIQPNNKKQTPTLILANLGFSFLEDMISNIIRRDWFFDILHSEHYESIPIRIANLIKAVEKTSHSN